MDVGLDLHFSSRTVFCSERARIIVAIPGNLELQHEMSTSSHECHDVGDHKFYHLQAQRLNPVFADARDNGTRKPVKGNRRCCIPKF